MQYLDSRITTLILHFLIGKLISGRYGHVTDLTWESGIPVPVVELHQSETVYTHDPSTSITISKTPFVRDLYEHSRVYVSQSRIPFAGEGLYAKQALEAGSLIALFNGVRIRDNSRDTSTRKAIYSMERYYSSFKI